MSVRPLTKRERAAQRAESGPLARTSMALERENQPDPAARERVVRYRAALAVHRATTKLICEQQEVPA
ncbi:MAG TPA: hypothetical protein VFA45_05505 [Actinomycetes bacterium]|jgi:hypothetical protein|nr:hypothetical protein [Actinomycetes bacterium]